MLRRFFAISLFTFPPLAPAADWPQDGGNAQRTAYTSEEPELPWVFAWAWNGPDATGGTGRHRYHQLQPHVPYEARICLGGGLIFAPAGEQGIFALRVADGTEAWHFGSGTCVATAAYDDDTGTVFVGTHEGVVYKLAASTGTVLGQVSAGGPVGKALLLADGKIHALTDSGVLHQWETTSLRELWKYAAGASAQTLPAFSADPPAVIFATADLKVHCVSATDGKAKWVVSPAGKDAPEGAEFTGGWPVVAARHGIVFVRLLAPKIDEVLWSGGGPKGKWPKTNEAIRQRLLAHPELQNLFALRLSDGQSAFIPAIGPAGVEDLHEGKPRLRVHSFPVLKTIAGREFAYLHWRNGDTTDPTWDARWDSHLGEMVLDADSVSGCAAGDLRFVQFEAHGGWSHVTDESCPLSMAGDTLFQAHWDVSQSARITDRSPGLGRIRSQPIQTTALPPVVRHARLTPEALDPITHWSADALTLMDGRYYGSPGFWTYANVLDPPTPTRDAYSEGVLPRFTCVAAGHIIVQGNGGELLVLRTHSK